MKELSLKMKLFPCLVNLLLGDQIRVFGSTNVENLVEYSYIPESAQLNESQFPIMSPYNLYKQKTSLTRSIQTLISIKRPLPKEYIQSSRLDQCALQASQSEQYVILEIP